MLSETTARGSLAVELSVVPYMTTPTWKSLMVVVGFLGAAGLCGCGRPTAVLGPAIVEAAPEDKAQARETADKTATAEQAGGEEFRFPDDQGGQLLSKLLAPADRPAAVTFTAGPKVWPPAAAVEQPTPPLPPAAVNPPHLPAGKAPPAARPAPIPEESPLLACRLAPVPPQVQHLPAGERVRTPAPDPNQPVALPVLGQATPDRASLDDPTADLSLAAALATPMPSRSNPAPFLRLNLPDPYEHRSAARLRAPQPEETMTPSLVSKPPRP
jgi:hypothetical protein